MLLSDNDFKVLQNAMMNMQCIELKRELGTERMTAKTLPASKPWKVAMLIQIKRETKNDESIQTFDSVEKAREAAHRMCRPGKLR